MPVSPDSAAIPRVSIAKLAKKAPDLAAKLAAVDADSAVGNGDGMADAFEVQTLPGPDVAAYCAAAFAWPMVAVVYVMAAVNVLLPRADGTPIDDMHSAMKWILPTALCATAVLLIWRFSVARRGARFANA